MIESLLRRLERLETPHKLDAAHCLRRCPGQLATEAECLSARGCEGKSLEAFVERHVKRDCIDRQQSELGPISGGRN